MGLKDDGVWKLPTPNWEERVLAVAWVATCWAEKPGRVLGVHAGAAPWVGLEWREIWANICPAEAEGWTMVTGGARPLFLGVNK